MSDTRRQELQHWAASELVHVHGAVPDGFVLETASDDASFRRYFRSPPYGQVPSYIFMDAPPDREDSEPFIHVAHCLGKGGLNVPHVIASDLENGFLMLTDLGTELYLDMLEQGDGDTIERHYNEAFSALLAMQHLSCDLADYDDRKLLTEMQLFDQWFLDQQLALSVEDQFPVSPVYDLLIDSATCQPQVFVHRDYHCRNLMVTSEACPGIIDFQDAVVGPVTYDLVSLLKDCYYRFDRTRVVTWVERYRRDLKASGGLESVSEAQFLRWFDLMGLQRHLKCAGIFSRLNLRDGKSGYLADIPLIVSYMIEVCELYDELSAFGDWLTRIVVPRLQQSTYQR